MSEPRLNKHELRTRETKRLLLRAAETLFLRDGYERADLGEIAATAGRTKGAIYAHFKSKEDIFLALIEEKTQEFIASIREKRPRSGSAMQNLAKMREFYLDGIKDQSFTMLLLEFKLYALRHPESRERLTNFFNRIMPAGMEETLNTNFGKAPAGKKGIPRSTALMAIYPMLSALVTESVFLPDRFTPQLVERIAGKLFDALMENANPAAQPVRKIAGTAAGKKKKSF